MGTSSTAAVTAIERYRAFPDRATWNRIVADTAATFLHTWEWGTAKASSGEDVRWFFIDGMARTAMVLTAKTLLPGVKIFWAPDGLFYQGSAAAAVLELRSFMSRNGVAGLVTRFTCDAAWRAQPAAVRSQFVPLIFGTRSETVILDLSRPETELFERLSYGIRRDIRAAQRHRIEVQNCFAEPDEFWHVYCRTASELGFRPYKNEAFFRGLLNAFSRSGDSGSTKMFWLRAVRDNVVLAQFIGGIVGAKALQIWSVGDQEGKKLGIKKLLEWKAITTAKQLGATYYDFGGVDRKHAPGIFHFKRRFGGAISRSSPLLLLPRFGTPSALCALLNALPREDELPAADAAERGQPMN